MPHPTRRAHEVTPEAADQAAAPALSRALRTAHIGAPGSRLSRRLRAGSAANSVVERWTDLGVPEAEACLLQPDGPDAA
jgi:hypothetical protein